MGEFFKVALHSLLLIIMALVVPGSNRYMASAIDICYLVSKNTPARPTQQAGIEPATSKLQNEKNTPHPGITCFD